MWKIENIVKKGDYLYAVVKDHPYAIKFGYVLYHRVIMENRLNRILNPDEVVHHINGDTFDNRIANLELVTKSAHSSMHGFYRGKTISIVKCPECGAIFEKRYNQTYLCKGGIFTACSRRCRGKFSLKLQTIGRTHEVEEAISENIVRIFKRFPDNSEVTLTNGTVETIRLPPENGEDIVQPASHMVVMET